MTLDRSLYFNVKTMSFYQQSKLKSHWHVNSDEFLPHFDILFLCNFDGRTIDVVLTYIFDIISMGGKMTQLQRVCRLLSLFDVISMHFNIFYVFFKVISFHLEIPCVMIAQCLRTVTPADICSDLTCLQLQWFSADILWNFPGSGQRRHPLSVSCRFMKMSMRDFFLQQL